jgi:hypothetical protein
MKIKDALKLDHVVIVTDDLENSVSNFRQLGFLVEHGGINGPTKNALISFKDGSYIELIATISASKRLVARVLYNSGILNLLAFLKPRLHFRFYSWFGGPNGLCDWCLRTNDIYKTASILQSKQIHMTGNHHFYRTRPDGKIAKWLLAAPIVRQLPFLIQDKTGLDIRVPIKESYEHPNKVEHVEAITLNGLANSKSKQLLRRYFGLVENSSDDFTVGNVSIKLSNIDDSPLLTLQLSSSGSVKGVLPKDLTCNAHIEVI